MKTKEAALGHRSAGMKIGGGCAVLVCLFLFELVNEVGNFVGDGKRERRVDSLLDHLFSILVSEIVSVEGVGDFGVGCWEFAEGTDV